MLQHIAHSLLKRKEIAPCNVSYSFSNLCFVVSCIAVFICVEIVNARVGRGFCPGALASPHAVKQKKKKKKMTNLTATLFEV